MVNDQPSPAWPTGFWFNEPAWTSKGDVVAFEAEQGSDLWRTTSYGFTRDSGHAFMTRIDVGAAVEVDLLVNTDALYDQAGILVRGSPTSWLKAGIEFFDDHPHLGAVLTHGMSDWSSHPVPSWDGKVATIRVSRGPDSVTVRARITGEPWHLVRLAPMPGRRPLFAGPYCCAPSRSGFVAEFSRFAVLPADRSLHGDTNEDA